LEKPQIFNRIGWYVSGSGTEPWVKFGFYATDWKNIANFPYPGKLIWGMPTWAYIFGSGEHIQGPFDPPIILPGKELIWACQAGWRTGTALESGCTSLDDYDVNPGNGKCGMPNVLGYAGPDSLVFQNCYWWLTSPPANDYSLPDPFPTSDVTLSYQHLPCFGWRFA
jgi:hypothetical protein